MTEDLHVTITEAFAYLTTTSTEIPPDLLIRARLEGIKAGAVAGDLSEVNSVYHDKITGALTTFFEGGAVTTPRNQMKQAASMAFLDAFELGWIDGGADLPLGEDALAWLGARLDAELGYIDSLFVQAKELRKETDTDFFAWVTDRADAYTRSLAGVYNAACMLAKKNQMLNWKLGNTEKHCDTCKKLDAGAPHRASWYIALDYIPRKAGAAMECGGYNCDCRLEDKDGNDVTV